MNKILFTILFSLFLAGKSYSQTNEKGAVWYITELPKAKVNQTNGPKIGSINSIPKNLEEIGVTPLEKDFQYFRVIGTDKMLVVKSLEYLRKEENDEI